MPQQQNEGLNKSDNHISRCGKLCLTKLNINFLMIKKTSQQSRYRGNVPQHNKGHI